MAGFRLGIDIGENKSSFGWIKRPEALGSFVRKFRKITSVSDYWSQCQSFCDSAKKIYLANRNQTLEQLFSSVSIFQFQLDHVSKQLQVKSHLYPLLHDLPPTFSSHESSEIIQDILVSVSEVFQSSATQNGLRLGDVDIVKSKMSCGNLSDTVKSCIRERFKGVESFRIYMQKPSRLIYKLGEAQSIAALRYHSNDGNFFLLVDGIIGKEGERNNLMERNDVEFTILPDNVDQVTDYLKMRYALAPDANIGIYDGRRWGKIK